jgi:glycosyltransferase involved in cell wall biosynthesis
MKVSVVVPVYNPGPHIDSLIDSLTRQTMPAEVFEVVFVDDGSTDGTPERLDRLAAECSNAHVIHQENSGWPGKPRNVGIDVARGEYVFFSDHDDWFGVEALERLYTMARRTDADIVIGKMVGHNRGVPRELFRHTVERATLADTPLIDSLTPHKLFRKAFLDKHGLRFPEGKRRLEDHVFVVAAYFLARTISVLADYPCYHHIGRDDTSNAGFTRIDPPSYYGYLRETLSIVESHTERGAFQDRLLRRFLRQELLNRLSGRNFLSQDADYQRLLFDEVRRLVLERFPTSVEDGLPSRQRLLAAVIRGGDLRDAVDMAEWSSGVRLDATLRRLEWQGGALHIEVQARLHSKHGPLLKRWRDRLLLVCPAAERAGANLPDVTPDLVRIRGDIVAKLRNVGDDVRPPRTQQVDILPDGSLSVTVTTSLDPQTAAAGRRLVPGVWDVSAGVVAVGWSLERRISATGSRAADGGLAAIVGQAPRLAVGYATVPHGNLSLDLLGRGRVTNEALARPGGRLHSELAEGAAVLTVPLLMRAEREYAVQLRLRRRGAETKVDLGARLLPRGEVADVVARLPTADARGLVGGGWDASLALPEGAAGGVPLGVEVIVSSSGHVHLRRSGRKRPSASGGLRRWFSCRRQSLRQQAARFLRRLRRWKRSRRG